MPLPSAFNTREKAITHLVPFNANGQAGWTAKLSIGRAVGHSQINLYANGQYAGTLQGDILGPALYPRGKNANGVEGPAIPLTWASVQAGVVECYAHPTPWGTWLCHDIAAAIFRTWGFSQEDVYRASPTGNGWVYVIAHIAAKLAVPGTALVMGGHNLMNMAGDGIQAAGRASQQLLDLMGDGFSAARRSARSTFRF